MWTYSCHPVTGKVLPGLISWAGKTQRDADVMQFTFDNGETLICTPDHQFPLTSIGFVRANELQVGQSMMPLYKRKKLELNKLEYEEVYDIESKQWIYTHQLVDNLNNKNVVKDVTPLSDKDYLAEYNITKIEILDKKIDVGTLTIDKDEKYHGYHTFALSCGIFTKNSNLSEIDDLRYFNNKLARGLRVPSSYLPTGPEDQQITMADGKMGTALIQEFRFNQYCERLQNLIISKLNDEFKIFLRFRGINIDAGMFDLEFNDPQNFASYRQAELDSTLISNYSSISGTEHLSKRFALKRFLGLTEEEMLENETLWLEENSEPEAIETDGSDMRSVGVTPGDFNSDLDNMEDFDAGDDFEGGDADLSDVDIPDSGDDLGDTSV